MWQATLRKRSDMGRV